MTVNVEYSYVDVAHFFTSHEVPGMCAASPDLEVAWRAAGAQAYRLLAPMAQPGRKVSFDLRLDPSTRIRVKAGSRKLPG